MDSTLNLNPEDRFVSSGSDFQFGINGENKDTEEVMKEIEEKRKALQNSSTDKYMIIGSVVGINDNFNKLMIIGYNPRDKEGNVSDYLACIYPNGATEELITFNHQDIKRIYFVGFTTEYGNDFKSKLSGDDFFEQRSL